MQPTIAAQQAPVRDPDPCIQPGGRRVEMWRDQPVAAGKPGPLDAGAGDGQCGAVAGRSLPHLPILNPDGAHSGGEPGRRQHQRLPDLDLSGRNHAGNDQPSARQIETPVNGKPEAARDGGRTIGGDFRL